MECDYYRGMKGERERERDTKNKQLQRYVRRQFRIYVFTGSNALFALAAVDPPGPMTVKGTGGGGRTGRWASEREAKSRNRRRIRCIISRWWGLVVVCEGSVLTFDPQ